MTSTKLKIETCQNDKKDHENSVHLAQKFSSALTNLKTALSWSWWACLISAWHCLPLKTHASRCHCSCLCVCLCLIIVFIFFFVILFMSLSLSLSPFEIDFKTVQHPRTLTTLRTAGAQSKRSSAKMRQALTKQKLLIENDCQKVRSFQQKIMKKCPGWGMGVLCTWGGIKGIGLLCYT